MSTWANSILEIHNWRKLRWNISYLMRCMQHTFEMWFCVVAWTYNPLHDIDIRIPGSSFNAGRYAACRSLSPQCVACIRYHVSFRVFPAVTGCGIWFRSHMHLIGHLLSCIFAPCAFIIKCGSSVLRIGLQQATFQESFSPQRCFLVFGCYTYLIRCALDFHAFRC